MKVAGDDQGQRAAATANQLRMVQISFADEPTERRGEYMREAIDRALDRVLPEERASFLKALSEHFPVMEPAAALPEATPAVDATGVPEETPEELVNRFFELAQLMEAEERDALVERLQREGLAPRSAPTPSPTIHKSAEGLTLSESAQEALQYLMRRLDIEGLTFTRTLKVMLLLIENAAATDQLLWNTWRVIAPNSSVRRPCDLRKEIAHYISGSKEVTGVQMKQNFDTLRRLTAALIAGVGQVGPLFARSHLSRFSPEAIEAQVEMGGGGLLSSRESRCWNQYVEQSKNLDSSHIEHEIRQAIAKYTESLMKKSAPGRT